ncbi:Putative efflux system component YknX [Polystyrenella longa]|uniref:Efflux system component YknX n=1 Tax=Polystyrenella longa TaxID=2528007 RepID=A0A518CHF8_9PLAN|nr:Putative efflux system component YknX [Polystyrenella longa]
MIVLLILGGSVWTYSGWNESSQSLDGELITQQVSRGPFRITIAERGTLESQSNVQLASNVEGTTTILDIVPEGTEVEVGQVVCVLDSSSIADKEQQQQITLTDARSKLHQAEEAVEIQETQNESDISKALLNYELAELDLDKYENGDYVQELNELQSNITLAEENLLQSEEDYQFAKRMSRKGYKTLNEVETARIAVSDTQLKLDIAKSKLNVLKTYTYERTIKELKENAKETERERVRVERAGKSALSQATAELEARQLTLKVEEDKLRKYQEQIEACIIKAPQAGKVIYNNSSSRRNESESIEEGTSVRERQVIIKLPDLTKMKVEARIHESRIRMLRAGLPAEIRVDALPGQLFKGKVSTVSSVPLSSSWMSPNLKEYAAEVEISGTDEQIRLLRPGMTAEIEIIVAQENDVLQIPVQAAVSIGRDYYVYTIVDGKPERREISPGETNGKAIEVLDGIADNMTVVLNPRTAFAKEISDFQELKARERRAEEPEAVDEVIEVIDNNSTASNTGGKGEGKRRGEGRQKNGGGKGESKGESESDTASANTGSGRPGGGDTNAFFSQMDKDSDGKISKEEAPGRMADKFTEIDANSDGFIDQSELKSAFAKMTSGAGAE